MITTTEEKKKTTTRTFGCIDFTINEHESLLFQRVNLEIYITRHHVKTYLEDLWERDVTKKELTDEIMLEIAYEAREELMGESGGINYTEGLGVAIMRVLEDRTDLPEIEK